MTKKDLIILRHKLPKSGVSEIHSLTHFSKTYIYKVLDGDFYNQEIIDAAIDIANAHSEIINRQKEAIEALQTN